LCLQAEDGIRYWSVTGVQTCALPICHRSNAYNWLAYSTRKNGDAAKAIPIYEKALAIDPKHRGAHEYIGEAYLVLGDLPKAKQHLAILDKLCFFPCEEYSDLKNAVHDYESSSGRVKPASTTN